MKRLVTSAAAVLLLSAVLILLVKYMNAEEGYSGDNTLTIYNWGDYIDPELIEEFEEESGYTVIYETFDSNEAMMMKMAQGGTTYDIVIPSEYAVEMMIEMDMLQPIDYSQVPNAQYIDEDFMDLPFDPGNVYSVPYFWGTVGIVYNPEMLGGDEIDSWNDLWNPEYENSILLVDGSREVMGFALNSLGYSLNDTDPDHLIEAKEKLDELMPNVKAIVGDEIMMMMQNNEAPIAVTWSGTAQEIMWENEDMTYVIPSEGSNLWLDNMCIPANAENVEGAHEFINFMCDPENAAQNAEYVGYSTPNEEALKYMDPEVTGDERFYPSQEVTENLEVYESLGKENLAIYNELYLQFKMGGTGRSANDEGLFTSEAPEGSGSARGSEGFVESSSSESVSESSVGSDGDASDDTGDTT